MQKNVVFWWDELLQVCGLSGTTFRVGKRSPVQGETEKMFLEKDLGLSKEEYFNESFRDIVGSSPFALFASLIDAETDAEELEQLEQLIAKKKEELKKEQ